MRASQVKCVCFDEVRGVCVCTQVAWIHIDRQMILTIHRHVIARIPRFSVSHDNQKTWQLHVSAVQQEDRGYYMCQVNTNPMISQVGHLQVVGEYVPPPACPTLRSYTIANVFQKPVISIPKNRRNFPKSVLNFRETEF
ncbi:hypothetical protein PR048_031719 [Dryococelus australis]|uniref:Immunoglobulin-like beta-sandwich domain-containing protein n=1 Tax=Dryococelus australis TaxID=614101 RepID=A0ABQ9G8Q1_9NEOP|nr:hypothetical protein PR048_031719 [Dryococelus australis]